MFVYFFVQNLFCFIDVYCSCNCCKAVLVKRFRKKKNNSKLICKTLQLKQKEKVPKP